MFLTLSTTTHRLLKRASRSEPNPRHNLNRLWDPQRYHRASSHCHSHSQFGTGNSAPMAQRKSSDTLNFDNYYSWAPQATSKLLSKALAAHIREPGPDAEPLDPLDAQKALGILGQMVGPCHSYLVQTCTTALELWLKLKATYASQSVANQMLLGRQLLNLAKSTSETISAYIARAQAIAMALASANAPVSDSDLIRHILAGLPEEYETYVAVLDVTSGVAPLVLNDVHIRLLSVECRIQEKAKSKPTADSTAYIGAYSSKPNYPPNNPAHRDLTCDHCGFKGHITSDCRKLKREQSLAGRGRGHGNAGRGNGYGFSGNHPPMAMMAGTGKLSNNKFEWVIDSGASAHMSPHHKLFTCFTPFPDPRQVTLGNGKATHAIGSGTIKLTNLVTLHNVLFVPDLACNLLSVSMAAKAGVSCTFTSGLCTLAKDGCTLLKAFQSHSTVYIFQASFMPDEPRQLPTSPCTLLWRPLSTTCCCRTTALTMSTSTFLS